MERLILDTTVLVAVERAASSLDGVIDDEDDIAIAAITAASLHTYVVRVDHEARTTS